MKKLLILSGKGGTGKTTAAAAFLDLSAARAAADCDVDAPNLHIVSRLSARKEVTDFFGGEKALADPQRCKACGLCREHCRFGAILWKDGKAWVRDYSCEGCGVCVQVCPEGAITLLPDVAGKQSLYLSERVFSTAELKMGRGNSGKLVSAVKKSLLKHAPDCPLAIIDGSPGIGCPVIASVSGVDQVLVVTEPTLSGLSDLKRLLHTGETFRTKFAVCVNKWDLSPEGCGQIEAYCREKQVPFLGRIPYDPAASKAVNRGKSLAGEDCPAGHALREIFDKLMELMEVQLP